RSTMTSFSVAGYMIFLAMVADMFDGRVARLTRTTSSFGGQLDSLSDAVSFGIAPAFLMMKVVEFHIEHLRLESVRFSMLLGRGVIFSAIFFVMFAVVRLARFNVENDEDESAHMNFTGLPSPAAAGVVASIVVLQQQILHRAGSEASVLFHNIDVLTVSILPAITILAGILMVTRIRYPHVANQLFRGKKTLPVFLAIAAVALLSIWNIHLVLVIGFCGFACFGFFRWCIMNLFRKNQAPPRNTTQS
ncbi:MAG: CDP-alcohol phosphatidyltransferase family protein, partial [Treponema sp.]|nr:CDP-alcohol phosphatidyltransferase family protein [Treponema sp.]